MTSTTPRDLMYSTAIKPISISSNAQTRRFLPITSGTYSPANNNIIRIPITANAFVDLKNAMFKFTLANSGTTSAYLDGSVGSVINRLNILSPDGAPIETLDNYAKLYNALSQLERNRDNYQGISNMLEGSSSGKAQVVFTGTGVASIFNVSYNGVAIGTFNFAVAGATTLQIGPYRLVKAADIISLTYRGFTRSASTLVARPESFTFGDFTISTTAVAGEIFLNGVDVSTAALATTFISGAIEVDFDNNNRSVALQPAGTRTFNHNLLSTITKLDVLYPAFSVSGGGFIIEITLSPSLDVLNAADASTATAYTLDQVEIIAPVIQYPESVVQSFKQMVQAQGSVSMSSVSFQSFIHPFTGKGATQNLSIPLAIRARSLKALYFFFQATSPAAGNSRSAARSFPADTANTSYQLQIGSQYYPAQNVLLSTLNIADSVAELEKSVSKLSDIRHGSVMNADNFVLSAAGGGTSLFGIDLEASATSFLENGINTADNSLTMYLNINGLHAIPNDVAHNVHIFAMFDNTISILPNGNLVMTK